jgi:hypothetical protein
LGLGEIAGERKKDARRRIFFLRLENLKSNVSIHIRKRVTCVPDAKKRKIKYFNPHPLPDGTIKIPQH